MNKKKTKKDKKIQGLRSISIQSAWYHLSSDKYEKSLNSYYIK